MIILSSQLSYSGVFSSWGEFDAFVQDTYSSLTNKHYYFPPFDAQWGVSMGKHFFVEEQFSDLTNAVMPHIVKGVAAYDIWIRETNVVSRVFITGTEDSGFRTNSVLPYDTEEWSRSFYGDVPDWFSSEEYDTWYRDRRRERIALHFTMIPCSSSNTYYQNVYIEHTNYLAHVNDPVYPVDTNKIAFTKVDKPVDSCAFNFELYSPGALPVDIFSTHDLRTNWTYSGTVNASYPFTQSAVYATNSMFFLMAGNGNLDDDGDGIPNAMETFYFGTNPKRWDTAGSLLSDWEKLYRYSLDPLVNDSDGDGLLDGEEIESGLNPASDDSDNDGLKDNFELLENGTDPHNADTDGDGLSDFQEFNLNTNPRESDTDNDELPDNEEVVRGTNPLARDSDGDGLLDGEELPLGADPLVVDTDNDGLADFQEYVFHSDPSEIDTDGDGLTDFQEYNLKTNPNAIDMDNDGLSDYEEFLEETNPLKGDTDNDGLQDGEEQDIYETNPLRADTDYDELDDGREIESGTDPCGWDTDGDGLLDGWEVKYNLDPLSAEGINGRNGDGDGDGIINFTEYYRNTNPNSADTDNDGLTDGEEIDEGTMPDKSDTDDDGLSDYDELMNVKTDPLNKDSDGDGLGDGWEVQYGLNPLSGDGSDGAKGDSDGDKLWNIFECRGKANPLVVDTDGDSIADGQEVSIIEESVSPPDSWRLDTLPEELRYNEITYTNALDITSRHHFSRDIHVMGKTFKSVSLNVNGVVFFHSDTANTIQTGTGQNCDLEDSYGYVNDETLTIAPFWCPLVLSSNSVIRVYEIPDDFIVIQYRKMQFADRSFTADNEISFQISMLYTNNLSFVCFVDYINVGSNVTNTSPSVGFRMPEGKNKRTYSYGYRMDMPIYSGLKLGFYGAYGTNPAKADGDNDGLTDSEEIVIGTDPNLYDTDKDSLSDIWEILYELDPLSDEGENGANGDPDNDGFSNALEYRNSTNPRVPDIQSRGLLSEINNDEREIEINIYGDYAAWEMSVKGNNEDTREWRIVSDRPGQNGIEKLKLKKGASYDLSMKCTYSRKTGTKPVYTWFCWQALIDGMPDTQTFDSYSSVRKSGDAEIFGGKGWIAENRSGLLSQHTHCHNHGGGNIAEGRHAELYVLDTGLIADYDRINGIDEGDAAKNNPILYHWVNNDKNTTGIADKLRCYFQWGGGDGLRDGCVNGASDTLDFTPVWLNIKDALTVLDNLNVPYEVFLSQFDEAVNVLYTSLTCQNADRFLTVNGTGYGAGLNGHLDSARVEKVTRNGIKLPQAFVDLIKNDNVNSNGVILIEGSCTTSAPLVLECRRTDTEEVLFKEELNLRISNVEDMFRRVDIRSAADGANPSINPSEPGGLPDSVCDGDMFVFAHGYNVTEPEAEVTAAQVFKRLRQAGFNSMFTAITWKGDQSRFFIVTPNYYVNVYNAFKSASTFADLVRNLPGGRKYIMAHSLGNMMASAAIQDYGMSHDKYFLLNAAVPAEAYDASMATNKTEMTPEAWKDYPDRVRASHWYELFPANDARSTLTWKDRFKDVQNVVNFYSSDEDVLMNGDGEDRMPSIDGTYAWYCQECKKGSWLTSRISEAGWGFNRDYYVIAEDDTGLSLRRNLRKLTPAETMDLADEQLRTKSFFGYFDDMGIYTNALLCTDYNFRAKVLGAGIPAESFATGANHVGSWNDKNLDLVGYIQTNGYPSKEDMPWRHGSFIKIPFRYNHKFYKKIIEEM